MKNFSIILIACLLLFSCGSSQKLPDYGEPCYLTQECLSAIDETEFDNMNQICNRKDEAALTRKIADKSIYVLNKYANTYTMLDKKFGKCKIQVNTGDYIYEVWVSSEFIKSK